MTSRPSAFPTLSLLRYRLLQNQDHRDLDYRQSHRVPDRYRILVPHQSRARLVDQRRIVL
jgi:hypothetical protein